MKTHTCVDEVKNELKLVVVGSVGSGKSTSIRAISEIPVCSTEANTSEYDTLHRNPTTTVALDYGKVMLDGTKLHLYGSPGERRFDFMASLLCKGANGMIIMIDNDSDDTLHELDYYLKFHGNFLKDHAAVIAVTHYDDTCTGTGLIDYHRYCSEQGFSIPVMYLDAREKQQVEKVIRHLLLEIDHRCKHLAATDARPWLHAA